MAQKTVLHVYDKTPFRSDYSDCIPFSSVKEQLDFFDNYGIKKGMLHEIYNSKEVNKLKKVKNTIRIGLPYKDCQYANYMRYLDNDTKEWVYCFVHLVNEGQNGVSELYYEIDVFNTYFIKLMKQTINGHIIQSNKNQRSLLSQGINTGDKFLYDIEVLNTNVNWIVIELLPSAKVSDSDTRQHKSGFITTYKNTRFFIAPFYQGSTRTIEFTYKGKTYKSQSVESIIEHLTNKFKGDVNTVNQMIHAYTSKHIGIGYKFLSTAPPKIEIISDTTLNLAIFSTGNGGNEGGGEGGGGEGGTGKAPTTSKGLMEKEVKETYSDINDTKMYNDVINFPRVKYHGLNLDNCKRISKIVEENGMSRHLFWAYEKSEGMGYNNSGIPWGWLNHTEQQGDVYNDASYVAKKVVSQCSIPNPVPLAWVDSVHNQNQPSAEVQANGQREANEFKQKSFGRGFVGLTAASTWAIWAPEFLKKEYNGVQDYADPWLAMITTFKNWK